jgi:transposase-like protein
MGTVFADPVVEPAILDRLMREIRRRARVVGAFPDGQSCLNLAAARLRHIAGTAWSTKRYLGMDVLMQHNAKTLTA